MKKLAPLGLIVALLVGTIAVVSPTSVSAQAGLVSSLLNNMDRNRRSLTSLRANISMEKYNAQIKDTDRYSGKVVYKPAAGRNAYVRVDWQKPLGEILAVADGQYTLYKTRLNTAYVGSAKSGGRGPTKFGSALDFLSMSRQQLVARFEPLQDIYEETLWGGVRTTHIKLVPKAGASYKYAEVWVDSNGMPIQTKVVEKNDDATTVRLTELERNAGVSLDEFRLQLGSDVKKIKS